MSAIDDAALGKAFSYRHAAFVKPRRRRRAIKWIAIAACLCLMAVGVVAMITRSGDGNTPDIDGFVIEDDILVSYIGNSKNVVIPDHVVCIADYAFSNGGNAERVERITLGSGVCEVRTFAFDGCVNLKAVELSDRNTSLRSEDHAILSADGKQLIYANIPDNIAEYYVPKGVRTIGSYALVGSDITSLTLPESVTELDSLAVIFNDSLERVTLLGVTTIGDQAFYNNVSLQSISAPRAVRVGDSAFAGCMSLSSVELPLAESIGENAFYGCGKLTSLIFPSLTSVGSYAFFGCGSLNSLTAEGLTEVGKGFIDNTQIRAIKLPDVKALSTSTFGHIMALWGYEGGTADKLVRDLQYENESVRHVFINMSEHSLPDSYRITYETVTVAAENGVVLFDSPDNGTQRWSAWKDAELICLAVSDKWSVILHNGEWMYAETAALQFNDYGSEKEAADLYGTFRYERTDDGIRITDYIGSDSAIVIPVSINGIPVVELAEKIFLGASYHKIESISAPGVKRVSGSNVVCGMTGLKSFSMPSLEEIPSGFFAGCIDLEVIDISSAVSIGSGAFSNCRFTEFYAPASLERMSADALENSRVKTVHARKGSYAEQWASQNGFGVVDIEDDYVPEYPAEIFDPSVLTYSDINTHSREHGFTGISAAYDRYGQMYAYIEAWDAYREIPVYGKRDGLNITASLCGDLGWIIVSDTDPNGYFRTLTVARFTRDSDRVTVCSIDLGTEIYSFGLYGSFYDESNGGLFICHSEFSWRFTFLRTNDGGATWYAPDCDTTLISDSWHDSPVFAKFVNEKTGIISYRYRSAPDLCDRTYVTFDGGRSWSLISRLTYPFDLLREEYGTEAVDVQYVNGQYELTVKVYDGKGGYYLKYRSADMKQWTLSE